MERIHSHVYPIKKEDPCIWDLLSCYMDLFQRDRSLCLCSDRGGIQTEVGDELLCRAASAEHVLYAHAEHRSRLLLGQAFAHRAAKTADDVVFFAGDDTASLPKRRYTGPSCSIAALTASLASVSSAGFRMIMPGMVRMRAMSSLHWWVAPSSPTVIPAWVAPILTLLCG